MPEVVSSVIVLIEDNSDHFEILRRLLHKKNPSLEIVWLRELEEAIEWLDKINLCKIPRLILLDIGLSKKNGLEVLKKIKQTPQLQHLVVIVLTSSHHPHDIKNAYDLHVNAYLLKPGGIDGYVKIVNALQSFWLDLNQLPVDANQQVK